MKKGIFFLLVSIGSSSFIRTDESKLSPIEQFQKKKNEEFQELIDNLAENSPIKLFKTIQSLSEESDLLPPEIQMQLLNESSELVQFIHFIRNESFQMLEKFLKTYNHQIENTESASVSIIIPIAAKITIDGKDVENIRNIPFQFKFDSLIAAAKEEKQNNLKNTFQNLNKKK